MAMVSCLLCYMARVGIIAAHVCTWSVRTYAGKRQNSTISGCPFMEECGILGLVQQIGSCELRIRGVENENNNYIY